MAVERCQPAEQGVRTGGPEWYAKWNPRNRVEGSYGILKNLAVIGYCRSRISAFMRSEGVSSFRRRWPASEYSRPLWGG